MVNSGSYILSLDAGTTSNRAIIFGADGEPRSSAQREFAQLYPMPGRVEHDPLVIWATMLAAAREAMAAADISAQSLAAVGIANQRETTIIWDRATAEPVYNAIVWQCRRTAAYCDSLKASGMTEFFQSRTGLIPDSYFSATKIRWILDNVPGARENAEAGRLAFGTVDSWLIYKLTCGRLHVTDVTNASRTMLYNIHTLRWDAEILDYFGIPASLLPDVVPSSGICGVTDAEFLGAPVPIAGIAGDQQAALFGQTCFREGDVKTTYGTGAFMLMNTGSNIIRSDVKLLSTVAWKRGVTGNGASGINRISGNNGAGGINNASGINGASGINIASSAGDNNSSANVASNNGNVNYALEGSVFVAGAAIQWLRDGLGVIKTAAESEALARSVGDTCGCYFVPAFTGLGAPYWDGSARGVISGLTRGVGRAHIVRAALEAIAYQVYDLLDAMNSDVSADYRAKSLAVDGGASANDFLMQFQADILGIPVLRPKNVESTALGAAYLAGLAAGIWSGEQELYALRGAKTELEPQMERGCRDELLAGWHSAVENVLGTRFHN